MGTRTVLVVEDDAAIRRGMCDALRLRGFEPLERADGPSGLETALGADLALVLLDVMLPGMDGFDVLERLRRARPRLPVIMVTARGAESDCVSGLSGGADDYVVKPFGARELLARVDAVLRRSAERPQDVARLDVSGRTIDFERREVTLPDGTSRVLTEREAATLRYLAASPGRAVARDELLQNVWGLDPRHLHTRTVDVHVARLREKLADDPARPAVIVTVRERGYMLARPETPS